MILLIFTMWLGTPKFGLSEHFKARVFKCCAHISKIKIELLCTIGLRLHPYPSPITYVFVVRSY